MENSMRDIRNQVLNWAGDPLCLVGRLEEAISEAGFVVNSEKYGEEQKREAMAHVAHCLYDLLNRLDSASDKIVSIYSAHDRFETTEIVDNK